MEAIYEEFSHRVQGETCKYQDITTIFEKLKNQGKLRRIFNMFHSVFESEHDFTITELVRLQQYQPDINVQEYYKINSHIFKSNLQIIVQLIVDDLWIYFTSQLLQKNPALESQSSKFNTQHDEPSEDESQEPSSQGAQDAGQLQQLYQQQQQQRRLSQQQLEHLASPHSQTSLHSQPPATPHQQSFASQQQQQQGFASQQQ